METIKKPFRYLTGRKRHPPDPSAGPSTLPQETSKVSEGDFRKAKEREELLDTLWDLYVSVEESSDAILDEEAISRLEINVKDFEIENGPDDDDGRRIFFKPATADIHQQYPIIKSENSRVRLDKSGRGYQELLKLGLYTQASDACGHIGWRFSNADREGIPKDEDGFRDPLCRFMGWRSRSGFPEYIFESWCRQTVFYERNPKFQPYQAWERMNDGPRTKPHLMLSMSHGAPGVEELRRGEILIILAAILSRMDHELCKGHPIIPIQLFSFMGMLGRIIQAYHDGKNLILYKSQLIDCTPYEPELFDAFVEYLASEPVGNTKELNPRPRTNALEGLFSGPLGLPPTPTLLGPTQIFQEQNDPPARRRSWLPKSRKPTFRSKPEDKRRPGNSDST